MSTAEPTHHSGGTSSEASTFHAVLYPHRSLGPRGFLVLMLLLGAVNFAVGVMFLMMGAWPIIGFLGLDVLLVYIAFRSNYSAAAAHEIVDLTPDLLRITRVTAKGERKFFDFNPYWVRLHVTNGPEGSTSLKIALHGNEFEFGSHLNHDERRDFASVFKGALARARSASGA